MLRRLRLLRKSPSTQALGLNPPKIDGSGMDFFQGVVTEYLVADRASFINTELLIQLDSEGAKKGRHWYCDAAAAYFNESVLYLCEVTYAKAMSPLARRLISWSKCWPELEEALRRDSHIPESWQIKPWVFIPENHRTLLEQRIITLENPPQPAIAMPYPKITYLENVVPWRDARWEKKVAALEDEA